MNRVLRSDVERWIRDGWHQKFGMSKEAHGYGETEAQVRAMPEVAMSDLLAYFDAVRQSTLAYLERMTSADIEASYLYITTHVSCNCYSRLDPKSSRLLDPAFPGKTGSVLINDALNKTHG